MRGRAQDLRAAAEYLRMTVTCRLVFRAGTALAVVALLADALR